MDKIKKNFKIIFGGAIVLLGIIAIIIGRSVDYYGSYDEINFSNIEYSDTIVIDHINELGKTYVEGYSYLMIFIGVTMIVIGSFAILYNVVDNKLKSKELPTIS